jgi:hypothetical protein
MKRVTDKVMPGGISIGRAGGGEDVRELPGGLKAAKDLFEYLGLVKKSSTNLT